MAKVKAGRPKGIKLSKAIAIKMKPELLTDLKSECERIGVPVSAWVRQAIKTVLYKVSK